MKKTKIIKMKDDYPLVSSRDSEKEKVLKKLKLYKIRFEPQWVRSAIGTIYVIAQDKEEMEEIANHYVDDSQLFGYDADWEITAKELKVSKNIIEKLLIAREYRYKDYPLEYWVNNWE